MARVDNGSVEQSWDAAELVTLQLFWNILRRILLNPGEMEVEANTTSLADGQRQSPARLVVISRLNFSNPCVLPHKDRPVAFFLLHVIKRPEEPCCGVRMGASPILLG